MSLLTHYRQLTQELKAGMPQGLYLLYGVEEYYIEQALQQISHTVLKGIDEALLPLNRVELDGRSLEIARLVQEIQTPPFFTERKLIIVSHAPFFSPRRSSKESDAETEDTPSAAPLADAIKNLTPGLSIVFTAETVNMRMTLPALVKKLGSVYNWSYAKRGDAVQDAQQLLKEWASEGGVSVHPAAQQRLMALVGNDEKTPFVRKLRREWEKLAAYKNYNGTITVDDVALLVTRSAEAKVFDVTDALSQRDSRKALAALQQLWQDGEEPLMVLSVLSRHFRQLLLAKEMLDTGYSADNAASSLGGHPFVAGKVVQACRSFAIPELKAYVHRCFELDYAAKTGQGDPVLGMEMLLVEACSI